MPELPEVETICQGIIPHCVGKTVRQIKIYQGKLRWPVTEGLDKHLQNQTLLSLTRRGKYLLFSFPRGTLIVHLGMSGFFTLKPTPITLQKHDHIIIYFSKNSLIYNDTRRFGAFLWTEAPIENHFLLAHLGPEPLSDAFNSPYLARQLKSKTAPIKNVIMNSRIVVGVGNIYANEALFCARIHPLQPANTLTINQIDLLVASIKKVLHKAITLGGTTLKDFSNAEGKPGYFRNELQVYGREGLACLTCSTPLEQIRLQNRTTVFCPTCQTLFK